MRATRSAGARRPLLAFMLRMGIGFASGGLACIGLGGAGPAASDGGLTRQIVPIPFNAAATTTVAITMDQRDPVIGSTVGICFQASHAGFASMWNVSTRREVTRIFPNAFAPGSAARVDADRRVCAGVAGDPFRFRVDGPPGTEDLWVLWTVRPELQPNGGPYADADALTADMRLAGAGAADWATGHVTYDIVPAGGNVAPPLPQPDRTPPGPPPLPADESRPKVLVLAMGANLGDLRKANQDAAQFTAAVTGMFGVRPDDQRRVVDAKFADFEAGIKWLRDRARAQDFVFIYFSGHGGSVESPRLDDGHEEFLVPVDVEAATPPNIVSSDTLADWIDSLPTRKVIAVIDACHSAGVFRSLEADVLGARKKYYALSPAAASALEAAVPATRGIRRNTRPRANGVLLAASGRDQSALEGPRGSFFTLALVRQLTAGTPGTLDDVFARSVVDTQTMTGNRQTPEEVGDAEVARLVKFGP